MRAVPLLVLAAALGTAYALGLQQQLSWAALAAHRSALHALVGSHPMPAAAAYVALYMLVVTLSLPGATVLTLAGGLLFGTIWGAFLAVIGATAGACGLFLIARYALADWLAARAGPMLDRLRPGLQRDGFSYLLALRLLPVVPFWLVNLAPALVGMRFPPFVAATGLGIIPATAILASIGAGIGGVLEAGRQPDLSVIFAPPVLLPLVGLALLSLGPIAWRRWKANHA